MVFSVWVADMDNIFGSLAPQPFSDVPNWRTRVLADQVAPGRSPIAAMSPKWEGLPESGNIDDRRGESNWRRIVLDWMGASPEVIMKMLKNPMTPLNISDPGPIFPIDPPGQLSKDAGLFDIVPSPMNYGK